MDAPFSIATDDVLAQPTRAQLFAMLGDLKRPAGTVELAERLNLHANGVRAHLERLEQAGLVTRARAPQPRGRPRDAWTIATDAKPAGQPPRAYAELGRWLGRAIPARPNRLREVQAAGREIGRELAAQGSDATGVDAFQGALAALGFQPEIDREAPRPTTVRLGNCPYRDAVKTNQPVICTLHRGITLGLLDALLPNASLTDFDPRDPDTAGCTIGLGEKTTG
jgi:predicted ArsR family transcriptional regulator